jgi:hypothetical protein
VILLVYLVTGASVYHLHWWVPEPLDSVDNAAPDKFVAGYAMKHVEALASFGVRNVGSPANEVAAPAYILQELQKLQKVARQSGAKIEIDRQTASGAFELNFLSHFTSVYENITNVVARLSWPGVSADHAILASAHYDSAWCGPGASDDLVQVGTHFILGG